MKQCFLSLLVFFAVSAAAGPVQLTPENSVFFFGEIDLLSTMFVEQEVLSTLKDTKGPVYLVIYSPGGMADPVMDAYPFFSNEPRLSAVVLMAASGAAAISQMVKGQRILVPRSKMLFHRIKTYLAGPVNYTALEKQAQKLKKMDRQFAKICSEKMLIGFNEYWKNVFEADWILDAEDAQRVGAGKIQSVECSDALRATNTLIPQYDPMLGLPVLHNFCDYLN